MSIITDARGDIVEALGDVGVKVYDVAPKTPIPPCLAVSSGSPWMVPERLGGAMSLRAYWRVMCVVRDGADYLPALEALVEDVLEALPDGVTCDSVGPPSVLDIGAQGSVLACDVNISAHLTGE